MVNPQRGLPSSPGVIPVTSRHSYAIAVAFRHPYGASRRLLTPLRHPRCRSTPARRPRRLLTQLAKSRPRFQAALAVAEADMAVAVDVKVGERDAALRRHPPCDTAAGAAAAHANVDRARGVVVIPKARVVAHLHVLVMDGGRRLACRWLGWDCVWRWRVVLVVVAMLVAAGVVVVAVIVVSPPKALPTPSHPSPYTHVPSDGQRS
ncbi:hypothetical protein K439DRAFT_1625442 [Ramaria rubella]|nr:hypothetical protein K439DRAFT_1625442 [Ramaria rubella]